MRLKRGHELNGLISEFCIMLRLCIIFIRIKRCFILHFLDMSISSMGTKAFVGQISTASLHFRPPTWLIPWPKLHCLIAQFSSCEKFLMSIMLDRIFFFWYFFCCTINAAVAMRPFHSRHVSYVNRINYYDQTVCKTFRLFSGSIITLGSVLIRHFLTYILRQRKFSTTARLRSGCGEFFVVTNFVISLHSAFSDPMTHFVTI